MRNWQHYQQPSVRMVFEELLFCANVKPKWFHGIMVGRGETIVSIDKLCHYTGFARATVVAALKLLVDTNEIKREKCSTSIKTTILNFDKYQFDDDEEIDIDDESSSNFELGTELGTELESELGVELGTELKQEYIKKDKEYKEDKESLPSKDGLSADQSTDPDKASQDRVDFVGLKNFFNKTMDEANAIIPRIVSISGKREGNVRARIREYGLDKVYEMITKASQSNFLNGENNRGWRADFTWLFLPSNFQKVLEGNYDNGNNSQQQNRQSGQIPGRTQAEDPLAGYDKIIRVKG